LALINRHKMKKLIISPLSSKFRDVILFNSICSISSLSDSWICNSDVSILIIIFVFCEVRINFNVKKKWSKKASIKDLITTMQENDHNVKKKVKREKLWWTLCKKITRNTKESETGKLPIKVDNCYAKKWL